MCKRIFKEQTSDEGEVPFYKIGTFGGEPDAFISRKLFDEYKTKYPYPHKGDILISASGSIGRTIEFTGKDEYFQDSNIVWLKHENEIDNNFLKVLYSIVEWSCEGSTIKRLYNDNFLKTEFMLPQIDEQIKLGDYFANLDNLITLHQRKSFLYFSRINDWEQRKLGDWGDFYYGRSCPKWSVTEDATIPCIRYGELYTKFGAKIDRVYSYTNMPPENLRFSKGTEVLIPRVGEDPMDYNHCTWLSMKDVAIGEMISVFNTDNNPLFTATMFNATLQNEFAMRVEGGSVTNLYFEKLKNIDVSFPSIREQEMIAAYFENIDNLITLHRRAYYNKKGGLTNVHNDNQQYYAIL